jgi:hypothetical protein
MLFPNQVLTGIGHPNVSTGGDGVAESGDDLLDLGQIIGCGGFPDLKGEDPGDDRPVFGSPDREHFRLLLGGGIPQD